MHVGVDIGASTIGVGAFGSDDPLNPTVLEVVPLRTANDFEADMAQLGRALRGLEQRHGPAEEIGVAVAGRLDAARQSVLFAGNLTGWARRPLAPRLLTLTTHIRRCVLGNDAEAQALYEALTNPALYGKEFVLVSVGTGIGTARVTWVEIGDKLVPICLPMEGQHLEHGDDLLYPNPNQCGCERRNCTERLASGDGVLQRFGKDDPLLVTPEEWDIAAQDLAIGLSWILVNHLVDDVVFGGGVSEKQPQYMGQVRDHLAELAVGGVVPEFVPATCNKLNAAVTGLTLLRRGAA